MSSPPPFGVTLESSGNPAIQLILDSGRPPEPIGIVLPSQHLLRSSVTVPSLRIAPDSELSPPARALILSGRGARSSPEEARASTEESIARKINTQIRVGLFMISSIYSTP